MPSEKDPIEELEARVAKMRALGVTRWGDIELGPEPPSEAADREPTQRSHPTELDVKAAHEKRRALALAASGGPRVGPGARHK